MNFPGLKLRRFRRDILLISTVVFHLSPLADNVPLFSNTHFSIPVSICESYLEFKELSRAEREDLCPCAKVVVPLDFPPHIP